MSDKDKPEFLPPSAPGAQPPPRWDAQQPETAPPPPATPPQPPPPAAPPPQAPGSWAPPSAAPPAAPPAQPAQPTQPAPLPPPQWGATQQPAAHDPYAPPPAGNGPAIASLVTAIAGIFFLLTGLGLVFFINIPASILGWVFGVMGKRKVDRGETTQWRGMAHAGFVMGVIGTILGVIAIVGWILAIALSEDFRKELEDFIEDQQNQTVRLGVLIAAAVLRLLV